MAAARTPLRPVPLPPSEPPPAAPARPRIKKLRLALILLGLGVLAAVSTVFGMMMAVASDLPALENKPIERNSRLVDVRGRPLGFLLGQERRILVEEEEISPAMKHAIIAIEDRRFYENPGVDVRAVGRALFQDLLRRRVVQGGSTITQQLVKNALAAQGERTLFNKLREAALAFHLTRKWTKGKILTEYLNAIYFGNGAYGVESAARTYFGRAHPGCGTPSQPCAAELEPHEAALIAGVVSSPSGYDPVSRPAVARRRRDLVLLRMLEQGYLSRTEYERARLEALPSKREIRLPEERSRYPYFTAWIKQQVVDLVGARKAFTGGLVVRTTLDVELQEAAEAAVAEWLGAPGGPEAALVALDNDTGEVRAMVGGSDYRARPFNLATQGRRQPGSAFKPFVLAAALDQGISPSSVWESRKQVIDVPRSSEKFVVNNYEATYAGSRTLAAATTHSDNAVYAQVGIKAGTARVARLARRMGIRTPVSRNYAITLGGLRHGVTPLDLANAYLTLARGGKRVIGRLSPGGDGASPAPAGIRELRAASADGRKTRPVELRDGRKALDATRTRRVLSPEVAETTTSILRSVVEQGTGTRAYLGPDRFAAGKTGTTENYGDAWFVGYTEEYTVAVWVGYPDRLRPMKTEFQGDPVAGGTYPAAIWREFILNALAVEERRNPDADEEGDEEVPTPPPAPVPTPDGAQTAPAPSAPATPPQTPPPATPAPTTPPPQPPPQQPPPQQPPPQRPPPQQTPPPTPAQPAPQGNGGGAPPAAGGQGAEG